MNYARRVKYSAILLAVTVSLLNAAAYTKRVRISPSQAGKDQVSLSEKRLQELKGMLPKQGTIGYMSDLLGPLGGPLNYRDERSDEESELQYALTQYALAPLVVDLSSLEHEFVVGHFRDINKSHSMGSEQNLVLLRDFGEGLMLFGRAK